MKAATKRVWLLSGVTGVMACVLLVANQILLAREAPGRRPAPHDADSAPAVLVSAGDPVNEGTNRRAVNLESGSVPEGRLEGALTPEEPETTSTERFRAALEDTLFGTVDVDAFMDVALDLIELKPGRANPEPDVTGALRYPLEGTPNGIDAELWVRRTNKSGCSSTLLSLRVRADAPTDPYLLAGAAREATEAEITVWRSAQGAPKSLAILTDVHPSGSSAEMGVPLDSGEIPVGIHYAYNAEEPLDPTGKWMGLVNGALVSRETTLGFVGGVGPDAGDLSALSEGLATMYQQIADARD